MKMKLRPSHSGRSSVIKLEGSAAELMIVKLDAGSWQVEWEVRQSQLEVFRGRVIMKDEQLRRAFDDRPYPLDLGLSGNQWLFQQYECDAADQGFFIRSGDYLNIPGPGTGHDGDPNISIEIDADIRRAVRQALGIENPADAFA